jgi:hypothetical protein
MEKIIMTLLVRRVPEENPKYPYAVQISFPGELVLRTANSYAAARLLNTKGEMASVFETTDFYHAHEWRAALLNEQAEYAAAFNGNPKPWYCVMRSLTKSVYDYPGSGDRDRNNGQVWDEIGKSEDGWTTEQSLRGKCQEELDTDWHRRIATVTQERPTSNWAHEAKSISDKGRGPRASAPSS